MRNVEATVEHLEKQIDFYRGEEARVSSQLDSIRARLNSDKYVLEILEQKRKDSVVEKKLTQTDLIGEEIKESVITHKIIK